jgi:predicted  nucleic acid-binding Zn-ribbon protein
MKKWMYVIFPSAMLGIFLFFYLASEKETERKELQRTEQLAKQKAQEAERKRVNEEKARIDAEKRRIEREADEAKKEAEKLAKYVADGKKIQDETDKLNKEGDQFAKESAALEIQIDTLRKGKDKASRDAFDLLRQVEMAKVARRNAEFEIQRTTEMISRRANESSLVRPPVIAAPAPAK